MSTRTLSPLAASLAVVPATLLLYIGTAHATGSVGDAQQRARQLLLGATSSTVSAAANAPRSLSATTPVGDAQESAQRLLVGAATSNLRQPRTRADSDRVHGDAQLQAQHVLLGRLDAPPAAGS
jgi:hypothetical protein